MLKLVDGEETHPPIIENAGTPRKRCKRESPRKLSRLQ
jgi:hypothetical protein